MFGQRSTAARAYASVGLETKISTSNPHQLIVMLYDGALLAIRSAGISMEAGDVASKGRSISQAINIVSNGLKASLDMEAGGELASRLSALYDYIGQRLLQANLQNNQAALTEVAGLLSELREAWVGIADAAAEIGQG